MAFNVNSYVSDLVNKDKYNLKQCLFEAFKRAGFGQLKEDSVYGLTRKEFVDLLTRNAKGYNANRELSAERYMQLQTDIQRVDDFFKQAPTYAFKTKLQPMSDSITTLDFESVIPQDLYYEMPVSDADFSVISTEHFNNWTNKDLEIKYDQALYSNMLYKVGVQIDFLNSLTPEQKESIFNQIKGSQISTCTAKIDERVAASGRYNEALTALQNWNPVGECLQLKEFLIGQIKQGLTYVGTSTLSRELAEMQQMTSEQFFESVMKDLLARQKHATACLEKADKDKKL